ncbi:MAG: acyltransferase [Chitinophagaceae bacterium]|nr:acyltransferase [Chitinophagaceae bacterium]
MLKKINLSVYYLFKFPVYRLLFAKIGYRSRLLRTKVDGYKRVYIGNHVYINTGGWLASMPVNEKTDSRLLIGDGTYIGRFCHIYATSSIEIGKKVLIADKVYISDNIHGYKNINLPVIDQPVEQLNTVIIGDGAWLGENVCVIGASIGKNSVVGANAIVTKNIPDYCVAVGSPAFIIKRYNPDKKEWCKTDSEGNFI